MKNNKSPNWAAIRQEYIEGTMSVRELADAHKVSENTLEKRAAREGWAEERRKIGSKVAEKIADRAAEATVNHLEACRDGAGIVAELVLEALRTTPDLSPSKLNEYMEALKKADRMLRDHYNVPTPAEAEAQRVAAARLDIERKKADADSGDNISLEIVGLPERYKV